MGCKGTEKEWALQIRLDRLAQQHHYYRRASGNQLPLRRPMRHA